MSVAEKIENVGYWIGLPTVRLTEKSPIKFIRVAGIIGTLPLFPLAFIGVLVLGIAALVGFYEMA